MTNLLENISEGLAAAVGITADSTSSEGYTNDQKLNDIAQLAATDVGWLAEAVPGAASAVAAAAYLAALTTDVIVFEDDLNALDPPPTQPLSVIADIGTGIGDILGFLAP